MRNEVVKEAEILAEKRGVPIYASNPSPLPNEIKKNRRARFGDDVKGLIVDNGSGEILGHGEAMVYEWEEVDKERFAQLYLAGLKQLQGYRRQGWQSSIWCTANCRRSPGRIPSLFPF